MISQRLRERNIEHRRAQHPFVLTLALILAFLVSGEAPPLLAADGGQSNRESETKSWHDGITFGDLDPLPTLGGRQFWVDRQFHAGWRIQQNVFTDHFRLLDPEDRRHAWGDATEVEAAFAEIRKDRQLKPASPHLVVLLHGWGRTRHMFDALSKDLSAAGYEVAKLSYPSTQQDLARHGADLAALLSRLEGSERVSFVTHSLGAMVLRRMLADDPRFDNGIALDRAVLIAPPSQGAELARRLDGFPLYEWIGGPVAADLIPSVAEDLPAPSIPFIVIAGGRGTAEGWNPLVPGDDDGIVGLTEAYLPGAEDFVVVPELHSFIVNHPDSIGATLAFLKGEGTSANQD